MNEDNDYKKQYTRIAAAEDLIEENSLMQEYVDLYKKKFRGEPLVDVGRVQIAQIKHLKNIAKDKAQALLHHYFSMSDPWFIQQAYSLDCLIKNLHKVNASFSQKTTYHKVSGKIEMVFHCDSCWQTFRSECDIGYDFLNEFIQCDACKAIKAHPKKVSKEERRETVLKLGATFPEMPSIDEVK